ncbi:MAG: hypothetical protein PHR06_07300 [Candidatus Cloacimonetes bacterium]|nr:hypothetical protein [Candidatus Cloacimonadota bacterium]
MEKGDIQIFCSTGFQIYCDDNFVGESSIDEDGKYLSGLHQGKHLIHLTKDNETPITFEVDVISNNVVELDVEKETRKMVIEDAKNEYRINQIVGNLRITSVPVKCEIQFLDQVIKKDTPSVTISNIPIGRYPIVFRKNDRELESHIIIKRSSCLEVKADFLGNEIIDVSARERILNRPGVICFSNWEKLSDYSRRFYDPSMKSIETMLVGFSFASSDIIQDVPITIKDSNLRTIERAKNSYTILPDIKPPIYIYLKSETYRILIDRDVQKFIEQKIEPGVLYEMSMDENYNLNFIAKEEDFVPKDRYQIDRDGF